jgi:hypothetical protein
MRTALSIGVGLASMLVASISLAQGDPPPPTPGTTPGATGTATVGATADANGTVTPPPKIATPAPAAVKKDDDGITDHEKVVGKFGVGYMGMTQLPIGEGGPGAGGGLGITQGTVNTPVIGVRYWLMEKIGIDAGIGFSLANSSQTTLVNNVETTTDGPAILGGALHAGLPLAFAYGKHYKFLLVPEVNLGLTRRVEKQTGANPPPDIVRSGFRFDIGARVGTEIQFGFIGVPELALQATVGLGFQRQVWSNSQDSGNGVPTPREASISSNGLGTTVQSDPWALLVNNISALYYFP